MNTTARRPGRVAQSVGHLTRKSEVLGSIPGLATYFRFSFRGTVPYLQTQETLGFLNMECCDVRKIHPWSTVDNTVMDVQRAVIKARILTGTGRQG